MKKKISSILSIVLCMVLVLGVTSTAFGISKPTVKNKKPVQITFSHCQGEWEWPILKQLGKNYTAKTGNTVKFLNIPADGYDKWLQAQMMAGTEPDIIWGVSKAEDFYKSGKILDLTSYLNGVSPYTKKAWKDSFLDGVLPGVLDKTTGKASLGIPLALVTVNLFYNKDVFKSLNIPDKAPQTWGEVLNIAKKVQASGKDIVPFSVMNSMSWNLGWIPSQFFEDLYANSGIFNKLNIITPNKRLDDPELVLGIKTGVIDPGDQRFIDYFTFMKNLSKYFNKGFNSMSWEYEKLFNDGKAAMELDGSWFPNQAMIGKLPVNYGVGPVPYVDNSVSKLSRNKQIKYSIGLGNPDLLVTAKAKKAGRADTAIDFIRYLTDPQTGAKYFVSKTMFLPVVKNVQVPDQMKGIVASIGTEESKLKMEDIFKLTPEEDKKYQDMYKVYLEDTTTPQEFTKKFKTLVLESADQYIEENPQANVEKFISKVKK